jgi:hypothetical protein
MSDRRRNRAPIKGRGRSHAKHRCKAGGDGSIDGLGAVRHLIGHGCPKLLYQARLEPPLAE